MATDLREKQRTSALPAATRRPDNRDPRWPYVATAIVLVVVAAVTVLVLAQGVSRPPASREAWQRNIEGLMTDVREGSGYEPLVAAEPITYAHGLENPRAYVSDSAGTGPVYANGALTGDREGSGFVTYVPTVTGHFPGPGSYVDGASTANGVGPLPSHEGYGAPTTDGRCL